MTQNITKSDIYQLVEIDGEMKIRDLDLAEKLGLKNPRDIKTIIKQNLDELQSFCPLSAMPTKVDIGLGLTRTVESFFLNEEQALLVCILSRTAKAKEVRRELIAIYSQYRHGELEKTNTRFLVEDLQSTKAQAEQIKQLKLQINTLQTAFLCASDLFSKIWDYNQKGLSTKEIARLILKSPRRIRECLQALEFMGFPVQRRKPGKQKKQLSLPFGG